MAASNLIDPATGQLYPSYQVRESRKCIEEVPPPYPCPKCTHVKCTLLVKMTTIEQAYYSAKTYQDLCDINVKFLQGVYDHTAYHGAPVNSETIPLLGDLCRLNALGMHTFSGQPATSTFTETPCKAVYCHQQRSYLEGFIKNKYTSSLKEILDNCDDVYYFIQYPDGSTATNIPFKNKMFRLHRDAYISPRDHIIQWTGSVGAAFSEDGMDFLEEEKELMTDAGVKAEILEDCAVVALATRDFNSPVSLEKLMIAFFLS